MSAQCLTCSLRKILFSVNLFVNLFIRQVCSFRLEHFARHFTWLFEFNSWSAASQCIAQLQILFVFSFSVCHSLRNSKVVAALAVVQLKNSKPVSVFAVRQFEVEQMSQHMLLFHLFAHNLLCSWIVNDCLNFCLIFILHLPTTMLLQFELCVFEKFS